MPVRLRMLPSLGARPGEPRGPTDERAIELDDGVREIRIGRRPDVEIPLPFPTLSGLHAQLTRASDGWRIEDLGSTNGTRVDGRRIDPGRPLPVAPGAQIALGDVTLVFDGSVSAVSGAEGTATIARRLVSDLFAASPELAAPVLTLLSGAPGERALRLETIDRRYLTGRAETCDLPLPSEEVSREHAAFVRRWDGVVVTDLGSKNGVRINEVLVREQRLHDGDRIQLGPLTLRLSDPADRYLRDFEARAASPPREGAPEPVPFAATAPLGDGAQPPAAAPPLDAALAPGAVAPPEAAAPAGETPSAPPVPAVRADQPARSSRTAIAIAAVVLLAVAAVAAALIFGS